MRPFNIIDSPLTSTAGTMAGRMPTPIINMGSLVRSVPKDMTESKAQIMPQEKYLPKRVQQLQSIPCRTFNSFKSNIPQSANGVIHPIVPVLNGFGNARGSTGIYTDSRHPTNTPLLQPPHTFFSV